MSPGEHIVRFRTAAREFIQAWENLLNRENACKNALTVTDLDNYFFQKDSDGNFLLDAGGNKIDRTDLGCTKAQFVSLRSSIDALMPVLVTDNHEDNFYKAM